jgi:hypothetical protein
MEKRNSLPLLLYFTIFIMDVKLPFRLFSQHHVDKRKPRYVFEQSGGAFFSYFSHPAHSAFMLEPLQQLPPEIGLRPNMTPIDIIPTTKRIMPNVMNTVTIALSL